MSINFQLNGVISFSKTASAGLTVEDKKQLYA